MFNSNLLKETMNEVSAIRMKMTDKNIKQVGDIVQIWDLSYNIDKKTGKRYSDFLKLLQLKGTVIATDLKVVSKEMMVDNRILDLLVKFSNGVEIYTHSDYVRVLKDEDDFIMNPLNPIIDYDSDLEVDDRPGSYRGHYIGDCENEDEENDMMNNIDDYIKKESLIKKQSLIKKESLIKKQSLIKNIEDETYLLINPIDCLLVVGTSILLIIIKNIFQLMF